MIIEEFKNKERKTFTNDELNKVNIDLLFQQKFLDDVSKKLINAKGSNDELLHDLTNKLFNKNPNERGLIFENNQKQLINNESSDIDNFSTLIINSTKNENNYDSESMYDLINYNNINFGYNIPNLVSLGNMNFGNHLPLQLHNQNIKKENEINIFNEYSANNLSSIKIPSDVKNKSIKFFTNTNNPIPNQNITNNSIQSDCNIDKENLLGKIRKRYIKNNKIVYVNQSLVNLHKSLEKNEIELYKIKQENQSIKDKSYDDENRLTDDYINKNVNIELNEVINSHCDEDENIRFSGDSSNQSEHNTKRRGSRYRGVSRNGNQWQVLIMVNKKKRYVGSYSNEDDAARAYDKAAIQNHGTRARTNFDYKDSELLHILSLPPILNLNSFKVKKEKSN